jgi:ZIP family zinc transporter
MNRLLITIAIIVFLATFLGGILVIKLKKTIHYFFAFAAGNLIAVAFFELIPETLDIAQNMGIQERIIMLAIVASFFCFSLVERYLLLYHTDTEDFRGHIMGPVGAGGLTVNSFLDGISIGVAFQVSPSIGLIVGLAVILHDITDGMNTVTIMLKNGQPIWESFLFLFLDSLAPLLGILLTVVISFPKVILVFLLAIFSGEFIYIGAASLLPETYRYPPHKMAFSMGLGILLILILTVIVL